MVVLMRCVTGRTATWILNSISSRRIPEQCGELRATDEVVGRAENAIREER